jgi:flagellar motor switch protein FliN/FliY
MAEKEEMQEMEAPQNQAEKQPEEQEAVTVEKPEFEDLATKESGNGSGSDEIPSERIEMLMDIVLPVSIELGRTKMFIKDILELERGSIVEIDKLAGEPVDLLVNNKKMAEGEVVVVDKHFGIRITNLIDPKDRIKNLGR